MEGLANLSGERARGEDNCWIEQGRGLAGEERAECVRGERWVRGDAWDGKWRT